MIIVNSRLLHQLHSLSVAHTHTIIFHSTHTRLWWATFWQRIASGLLLLYIQSFLFFPFGSILHFSCERFLYCQYHYVLLLTLFFLLVINCNDQIDDMILHCFNFMLLFYYYDVITLWYYCLLLWLASQLYFMIFTQMSQYINAHIQFFNQFFRSTNQSI